MHTLVVSIRQEDLNNVATNLAECEFLVIKSLVIHKEKKWVLSLPTSGIPY